MTPEQNRDGFPVEIKELKADGLSSESREFPSFQELDRFVHRRLGYTYETVKRSKDGKRKRKYVISSPSFQHGRKENSVYYIITKVNHKQVANMDDVRAFYMSHPSYQAGYTKYTERPKKSREQLLWEKERRRHLLLVIDTKYDSVDKAEGSPELEELRKLIGAKV